MSEKSRFIYRRHREDTLNDSKIEHEEFLRDGPQGLGFRFKKFDKKKNIYLRIDGKLSDDGKKVALKIKEEGKEPATSDVKVEDLKKHKDLKFVVDYIAKDMAKFRKTMAAKKGGKKKSRKASKKKSKRKTSRKKSRRKKSRKLTGGKKRKGSKKKSRKKTKKKSRRKKSRKLTGGKKRKGSKKKSRKKSKKKSKRKKSRKR